MEYTANYKLVKPAPEEYYDIVEYGDTLDVIDAALSALEERPLWRVVASRDRDPGLPDYGLDKAVMLRAAPYTGTAEITLQVEQTEYDAENMSARPQAAPSGTIIIKKVEE